MKIGQDMAQNKGKQQKSTAAHFDIQNNSLTCNPSKIYCNKTVEKKFPGNRGSELLAGMNLH